MIGGLRLCASLFVAALLSACATEEILPVADRSAPVAYRNRGPAPELPRPSTDWWREFSSAELDRLQEAALANNRDLQVAIARVAQAQAQVRLTDSARFPNVEAFARREAQGPDDGVGSVESRDNWRSLNRFQLGLRVNYEADLWGKQGYATESALALAVASVHQREAVALTLTAEVAASYLEYLSLNDRIAIAERAVQNRRNSLGAVTKRMVAGDATSVETALQAVALGTTESALSVLVQRRERGFNRLAVLTGQSPAQLKVEAPGLAAVSVPPINPGLPSELLCRRPDIRRQEAQLAAAQFDVNSLRANLLPSFALNGELGYGSRHLAALGNPASLFFLAAGTLAQTLFDAGRKESQVEGARARYLEMLHQYSGTLLTAFREVEDAIVGTRLTEEQHRALAAALDVSRKSFTANQRSYQVGAVDFLALLELEQRLVATEDAAEAARYDRMRAAIDLFRSLGGGTRTAQGDPCVK
jgi:NodT family efflux transporter outer membrane factor (OMF) lipoprotein